MKDTCSSVAHIETCHALVSILDKEAPLKMSCGDGVTVAFTSGGREKLGAALKFQALRLVEGCSISRLI